MQETTNLLVDAAVLIDGSLPEEERKFARALADGIFESLARRFYEDFEREAVINRREVIYSVETLPRALAEALAALTPPPGEGKRRNVLLVFHGSDGSVAGDTAAALTGLTTAKDGQRGKTRVIVFSRTDELTDGINAVGCAALWGVPRGELCEETADEVAELIYH